MAKFNVVDMNGQHVSEIELSDAVFGITPNEKAVHIAVVNFHERSSPSLYRTAETLSASGNISTRAGASIVVDIAIAHTARVAPTISKVNHLYNPVNHCGCFSAPCTG